MLRFNIKNLSNRLAWSIMLHSFCLLEEHGESREFKKNPRLCDEFYSICGKMAGARFFFAGDSFERSEHGVPFKLKLSRDVRALIFLFAAFSFPLFICEASCNVSRGSIQTRFRQAFAEVRSGYNFQTNCIVGKLHDNDSNVINGFLINELETCKHFISNLHRISFSFILPLIH